MANDPIYDERALLDKVAAGDEAAFSALFIQYASLLEMNIRRLVKDDFATSEVLQETFIRIWLNREKLTDVREPRAYLNKIALNECFSYLNRLAKQDRLKTLAQDFHPFAGTPEDSVTYKETEAIIQQAIEELPGQRKAIYELSRNKGLNSTEIARELNISADYARQAISAARRHIRDRLIQAGKLLTALSGFF